MPGKEERSANHHHLQHQLLQVVKPSSSLRVWTGRACSGHSNGLTLTLSWFAKQWAIKAVYYRYVRTQQPFENGSVGYTPFDGEEALTLILCTPTELIRFQVSVQPSHRLVHLFANELYHRCQKHELSCKVSCNLEGPQFSLCRTQLCPWLGALHLLGRQVAFFPAARQTQAAQKVLLFRRYLSDRRVHCVQRRLMLGRRCTLAIPKARSGCMSTHMSACISRKDHRQHCLVCAAHMKEPSTI